MKKVFMVFLGVVFLSAIAATVTMAATEYPIDYVLENPANLANNTVVVRGVVENSTAVQSGPMSKIKGEYDLRDKNDNVIHIKTTKAPPPNGILRKVTGKVDISDPLVLVLVESTVEIPMLLLGALGLLVLLAIVLVVLLVSKPSSRSAPSVMPLPPPLGPTHSQSFGSTGSAVPTSKPTVAPSAPVKKGQKPTVQISAGVEEKTLGELTVVEGEGARYGTKFALHKGKQKIGRSDDMDISLEDETVSREHASIWWQDNSFYLQDEASSAGTTVNGQKITRQALADNDTIQLGKTKLVFRVISG